MEFKFSCKWFEIAFSGDPGYVAQQLEKYEPYVLSALRQVESEAGKDGSAPRPAAPPPQPPRDREQQPRDPGRQPYPQHDERPRPPDQTRRFDRPPRGFEPRREDPRREDPRRDDDRRYRQDPPPPQQQRRDYSDQRPEQKKNEPAPQPVPVEVAEEITRDRVEGMTPDLICDALAEPEGTCSEETAEVQPEPAVAPAETETIIPPPPSAEFAVRRRAPRVREDELAKIIGEKKPRTHHDRVMVFGFYMEQDGGGSDFTVPEIKRCYEAANLDPGSNIEQVINHATRSGFIVRSDKGKTPRFKLSNKGKRYVADGLKLA